MESITADPVQGLETMSEAMEGLPHYYDWLFAAIQPFLGTRVLEVGPGYGDMADRIREAGHAYFAIDSNAPVIKRLAGLRPGNAASLFVGDITDSHWRTRMRDLHCDTIVTFNVLEHVQDDVALLRSLSSIVPGGRLVIFVPALPGLYGSFDREVGHYRRYARTTLMNRIEKAGFVVTQCRYFNALGALSWLIATRMLKLNPHGGSTQRSIKLYDRFCIPVARRIDPVFASFVGQSLLAVANAPPDEAGSKSA
jgi:SAM-dependent methyltransferase